jgi:AGCS family alanine or glycine:cation symporter
LEQEVAAVLGRVVEGLWCPWLLGLFLVTGLVYSVGSGFFQWFEARLWLRCTAGQLFRRPARKGSAGLSSLQALATALASTMGTGSIAGVATALTMGGPGAVFWMWISAFLGMMTSCGEKLLAVRYQRVTSDGGRQGGPMFYLRDGMGAPALAVWFALACLPATLAGGDLIQSSAIASALETAFGLPRLLVGLGTALLAGLVMVGGVGRIARVSSALVPAMALLYLGSGVAALVCRASALPGAIRLIFSCALSPTAPLAGGTGWTVACAARYGVARGIFTNEAGLGTSAIAHGAACVDHPAQQGMWGIFEVFLSTFVVCTVTALVILTNPLWLDGHMTGAALTAASFAAVLGNFGENVVAISLLLFAFSSILGWSYYGQQSLQFLGNNRIYLPIYRTIFLVGAVAGAVWEPALIWQWVDLFNALMAIPNLIGLLFCAPEVLSILHFWAKKEKYDEKLKNSGNSPG